MDYRARFSRQNQTAHVPEQHRRSNRNFFCLNDLARSPLMGVLALLIATSFQGNTFSQAWSVNSRTLGYKMQRRTTPLFLAANAESTSSLLSSNVSNVLPPLTTDATTATAGVASLDADTDDDDEYDYIEYDTLTEEEFIGSEWLVGTNWDRNPNKIDETWVRLATEASGKNIAIWGDNSQGTWNLDAASQFLSISKENLIAGKEIWACTVTDYYYLTGTVRGWKYWSTAAVLAQWQAKRLGMSPDEAGIAPWFQEPTEQERSSSE